MDNNNDVFDAFRCCVTDQKCMNHECPYEEICSITHNGKAYVQIPKVLALNVLEELKSCSLDTAARTINDYLIKRNNGNMQSEDFYWWHAVLDMLPVDVQEEEENHNV